MCSFELKIQTNTDPEHIINREKGSGSLIAIVNDFEERTNFYDYLVTEFSVQHFHFWEDTKELMSVSGVLIEQNLIFDDLFNNLIRFAKTLFDNHISNNLDFVVGYNIDRLLGF